MGRICLVISAMESINIKYECVENHVSHKIIYVGKSTDGENKRTITYVGHIYSTCGMCYRFRKN